MELRLPSPSSSCLTRSRPTSQADNTTPGAQRPRLLGPRCLQCL
nr:MAG TPA: hypothetical protein [Caudoviricetes sp.]